MADPISLGSKVDLTKWKKLTAQEIIKEESKGEEVPAEIIAWAQQMAAIAKIPDNVTYEQVDGDIGLDALEKLGIEDEDAIRPEAENAEAPAATEEPDAVKDPAKAEETEEENDENIFANTPPGQAADASKIDNEEEVNENEELTLADKNITTDSETIRKRKARKGLA